MPVTSAPASTTTRLLLARHGSTSWNRAGRRLGREDVPLDEIGLAQVEALRAALADHHLDRVVSSPLIRARKTAGAVAAERSLEVIVDDDLVEFDFGEASGSLRRDRKLKLREHHMFTPVPGGESLFAAWERAERAVARLRVWLDGGEHVLVVGHERINRLVESALRGTTFAGAMDDDVSPLAPGEFVELHLG